MEAVSEIHPSPKTRSLSELAIEALLVQDACNLSGVVRAFARAMSDLLAHPDCKGTDWANNHPVAILYADKVAHLTGTQMPGSEKVFAAYREAKALIDKEIA